MQLNKLRNSVSELELRYGEKKKAMKFEIQLEDEKEDLEEIDNKAEMMDEQEIDEVDLTNITAGQRATLGAKPSMEARKATMGRKATLAQSKTADAFIEAFNKEKAIEQGLERERAKNPGRWYRQMNYDLHYMRKLQDQRDRIIMWEGGKQKSKSSGIRCSRCLFITCRSVFCNIQTAILWVFMCLAFAYWIYSMFVKEAPEKEFDPIVIPDADASDAPLLPQPSQQT